VYQAITGRKRCDNLIARKIRDCNNTGSFLKPEEEVIHAICSYARPVVDIIHDSENWN
jgi:hypothetical protein